MSRQAWGRKRIQIRAFLEALLGDFPQRSHAPQISPCAPSECRYGYRVEQFTFSNGTGWTVPGVCYVPAGKGPFPAILWCHWHGGMYREGIQALDKAEYTPEAPGPYLASQGYVVLGIDAPGFGKLCGVGPDKTSDVEGEASIAKYELLYGRTMLGLMLHNDRMALDLLCSRKDVDPKRIGTAGISMGCLRALWLAALDDRVRATVAIACLTSNQDLLSAGGLHYHGIYYYVPGLLRHFDMEAVVACIAPRAFLSLNGELDPLTPKTGIHAIHKAVKPVWSLYNADQKLRIGIESGVGHAWTPSMWCDSIAWLSDFL